MHIRSDISVAPGLGPFFPRREIEWRAVVTVTMTGPLGKQDYKSEKEARAAANEAVDRVVALLQTAQE